MRVGFSPSFTSNRINMNNKLGNKNQSTGFGNGKTDLALKVEEAILKMLNLAPEEKLSGLKYLSFRAAVQKYINATKDVDNETAANCIRGLVKKIGAEDTDVEGMFLKFANDLHKES